MSVKNKMTSYPLLKSRKIKYDSPSGYVHIGKYIPPNLLLEYSQLTSNEHYIGGLNL